MDLNEYSQLFDVDSSLFDVQALVDSSQVKEVNEQGYAICKDVINPELIEKLRVHWVRRGEQPSRLRSDFCLGEENFSHKFFGKYTRHFEFYWNTPSSQESRDLSLLLHFARNVMFGFHPLYGLSFLPKRVGIYLAITHYPAGSGEMAVHVDPNYFLPIHFVLPLTFKGLDYKTGGLHIHKDDQVIDAEAKLSPGDVLFFNGGVPHEVVRVEGAGSQSSLGRLQMFSIPTEFEQGKPRRELLRALAFELYGRAKYTGYKLGLGFQSEHQNFR